MDPILPMCEQSCLSVGAVNGFQLLWKLFLFNLVDTIVDLVDMELSCGLWIVYYFNMNVYENFDDGLSGFCMLNNMTTETDGTQEAEETEDDGENEETEGRQVDP